MRDLGRIARHTHRRNDNRETILNDSSTTHNFRSVILLVLMLAIV